MNVRLVYSLPLQLLLDVGAAVALNCDSVLSVTQRREDLCMLVLALFGAELDFEA